MPDPVENEQAKENDYHEIMHTQEILQANTTSTINTSMVNRVVIIMLLIPMVPDHEENEQAKENDYHEIIHTQEIHANPPCPRQ